MKAIWTMAKKDLLVLSRDKSAMLWMLGMPILFAVFFGAVFGGSGPDESNPLQIAVVAEGLTEPDKRFVQRLDASDAIAVDIVPRERAEELVRKGQRLAWLEVVHVPDEELGMFAGEAPEVNLGIDPSRGPERGLLQGLVTEAMFAGFRDLMSDPAKTRSQLHRMADRVTANAEMPALQKLALKTFFAAFDDFLGTPAANGGDANGNGGTRAFEPRLNTVAVTRERSLPPNMYSISFPQSILWAILGCAAGFAMTLVRERTSGTMVRLLTAPLTRAQILAGKALACALACCIVTAVLTTVGAVVFGVTVGSVPLLALATATSALCFAGLTMLLGSLARTEQAVSGIAWGTLLVFAMLGGGMVPQIGMPSWMLSAGSVSPARWMITALEGAIWRGFTLAEMALPCAVLVVFGLVALTIGCVRLSRTD
ncbi:MAG: ABC transporter permease [Planctomycetota bacterium]